MSRKINSLSLRLGLFQVWSTILNCYGKNLQPYNFFWSKKNLENYLYKFFINKSLTLGYLHWTFQPDKVLLTINYINFLGLNVNLYKIYKDLVKVLSLWTNASIYIYIFEVKQLNMATFISLHFYYNSVNNSVLKSVLKNIRLNTKRVVMSSTGPIFLILNGFKVSYAGRIDNSRNSMSKTIKLISGSTVLSSIINYVDYDHKIVYTKLGICSVHVWVSYTVSLN